MERVLNGEKQNYSVSGIYIIAKSHPHAHILFFRCSKECLPPHTTLHDSKSASDQLSESIRTFIGLELLSLHSLSPTPS